MIALVGKAEQLVRGPRFQSSEEFWDEVSIRGYAQVISLQEGWADVLGHYNEEDDCKKLGVLYMRYRLSNFTAPKKWECHSIVQNILLEPGLTYLHCFKGVDRTGFISGLYLVLVDGMDPQEAWDYVGRMGMQRHYRILWASAFFKRVLELQETGSNWRHR